jgi:hypothetical protein
LGIERAKRLITFCLNDRAHRTDQHDFNLLLSVFEGEVEIGDDYENMIDDSEDMKVWECGPAMRICDWQTSTLQPSQGITTHILNFLFGMATLYMKNSFQTYVYCFHRSVEIVSIQESQAVIEDSAKDTQQSFPEP